MMEELPLFKIASAMARHATARHRVVAENVANADTPAYQARDVKAFSEYVKDPFTAKASRADHAGWSPISSAGTRPELIFDKDTSTSGNGNSVSLETEMLKGAAAKGQHAMATAIYSKAHDLMRLGLGRR